MATPKRDDGIMVLVLDWIVKDAADSRECLIKARDYARHGQLIKARVEMKIFGSIRRSIYHGRPGHVRIGGGPTR